MSNDLTIIAIVFTLILLIVFFSAVVLYLAFRIKETFKKETKKGANAAKTAFLIGIIFLAGGIMYFAASTLTNTHNQQITTPTPPPGTTSTPTTAPTATPTPKPGQSPTPMPTASTPPSATPTPNPTATPTPNPNAINFSVYPSTVTAGNNNQVTIIFTIYNPTSTTLTNTVIQTNDLFQYFNFVSGTSTVSGSTINVGNVPTGTTQVTLQLTGKTQASATVIVDLLYQGMPTQLTTQITISRGK